jgi:hypothetical protein
MADHTVGLVEDTGASSVLTAAVSVEAMAMDVLPVKYFLIK